MKSDESFIDIFLEFMNDETADARAAETRFMAHPYCAQRVKVFQGCPDKPDYKGLRNDMLTRLKIGESVKGKKWIVEQLNELALKVPLMDKDGRPIRQPNGEPLVLKIGGLMSFRVDPGSAEAIAEPAVTGMEYACWYSLLLISRHPKKIKRCALKGCNKLFRVSAKRIGYCSPKHAQQAEKMNSANRTYNSRHPDKPRRIVISTASKHRRRFR
jgi:hypothetical protein